ncbi:hypothetical protein EFP84_13555 [Leptospira kmetyi]|uniref:PDZ domain-containing protein n=1 Tax=Leptospira kmetyi TaxID=408139 RepID=A0AAD0URQ6_9LEPT|nr:hypothetical protein [Leptospira kmetyi]AYV56430.1 hypothetical protein EFP84_13555 [Leptospira kmetyi]
MSFKFNLFIIIILSFECSSLLKKDLRNANYYFGDHQINILYPLIGFGFRVLQSDKEDVLKENDVIVEINDISLSEYKCAYENNVEVDLVKYYGFRNTLEIKSITLIRNDHLFRFYKEASGIKKSEVNNRFGFKKRYKTIQILNEKVYSDGQYSYIFILHEYLYTLLIKSIIESHYKTLSNIDIDFNNGIFVVSYEGQQFLTVKDKNVHLSETAFPKIEKKLKACY